MVVAAIALVVARGSDHPNLKPDPSEFRGTGRAAAVPTLMHKASPWFVYAAAGVTGFVFFLQELVWYRMLTPLMGGSAYTFGMILGLALFGVGVGGFAYRVFVAPRAGAITLRSFALLCALQACLLAAPYALGDRVAVFAWHANNLRCFGFGGQVLGWTMIAAVVVLGPGAFGRRSVSVVGRLVGRRQGGSRPRCGQRVCGQYHRCHCRFSAGRFCVAARLDRPRLLAPDAPGSC